MKQFLILFLIIILSVNFYIGKQTEQKQKPPSAEEIRDLTENTYTEGIYAKGFVLRWSREKFPITVYIDFRANTDYPDYYIKAFKDAAIAWQKKSEGIIKIQFVQNRNDANIVFSLIENKESKEKKLTTAAFTHPVLVDDKLDKMEINVTIQDPAGNFYKEPVIRTIAYHEFGHALGIMGHSDDENDIMYPTTKIKNFDFPRLSNRDKSTLELLYRLVPDATNGPVEKNSINKNFIKTKTPETQETY